MRAATSSASSAEGIGPPGWMLFPDPRVSGAITRKCSASVAINEA